MKKILFSVIAAVCCFAGQATEGIGQYYGTAPQTASKDSTSVMSLDQIIAQESKSKLDKEYDQSLFSTWGKNTYLNLIYNTNHKMSSEEFPSTTGAFSREYEPKFGVGLEWGHTFNFHKRPVGSVVFFGLDFTWMDLDFNKFEASTVPVEYTLGEGVHNMPWHNEKMTIGYGMNLGPSLTFYPFTPLRSKGANKVRLQFYFHVGYCAQAAIIKDGIRNGKETKNGFGIGHGLYTSYGANLSWDFIGVGYEFRNDNKLKYKVTDSTYDTGTLEMKEKTGRLYLQFRF
jgi:opacity protein-like surface antigen